MTSTAVSDSMNLSSALADYATDLKINQTYVRYIQEFEGLINKTSYDERWNEHHLLRQKFFKYLNNETTKTSAATLPMFDEHV